MSCLPIQELREVLSDSEEKRKQLFVIAEIVDDELVLFDGNLKELVVPLSVFTPSNIDPDFTRLKLVDYGQGVAFGNYEASSEFCLHHAK